MLRDLLEEDGKDVLVFGSRILWNDLLAQGLVTELHLLVGPRLLGDGVPVYTGPPTTLHLAETRRLVDSALVLHRYLRQAVTLRRSRSSGEARARSSDPSRWWITRRPGASQRKKGIGPSYPLSSSRGSSSL